jgi:hypothetical protein
MTPTFRRSHSFHVVTERISAGAEGEMNDTDARLWHPWLRINRVLRVMLHAEAWSVVRVEFRRALTRRQAQPAPDWSARRGGGAAGGVGGAEEGRTRWLDRGARRSRRRWRYWGVRD